MPVPTSAIQLPPNATGFGTEQAGATISGDRIWLRVNAEIRPGAGRRGRLSYSTDGTNVTPLGRGFVMGLPVRHRQLRHPGVRRRGHQSQFTLTDGTPAPSRLVSLRAHANGRYVAADNTGVSAPIASRTTIGTAEQFDLIG